MGIIRGTSKRSERLEFRCTPEEKQKIETAARLERRTVTSLLMEWVETLNTVGPVAAVRKDQTK